MAGKTIIVYGNSQLSTSVKKFGTASGLFDGTGDFLGVAGDNADFNFATGDFSVDFWFRPTDSTKTQYFYTHHDTDDDNVVIAYNSGKIYFIVTVNGIYTAYYFNSHSLTNDTWYHYEFTRSGTNFYIFKDGVSLALTVIQAIGSSSMPTFGRTLLIGYVWGYIDEFRVSKGIARHTSDFAVPSSAYTSDSYTKLLLHMDGTDGSTSFVSHDLIQYDTHTCNIELLQYQDVKVSEAGTTTTIINITGHGLVTDDFIVNTTRCNTEPNASAELRACRRVKSATANTITVDAITGQVTNDDIRLYKFVDISQYVMLNSIKLSMVAECEDSFAFTMKSSTSNGSGITLLPEVGQYVRIKFDGYAWFTGIINNISYQMNNPDSNVVINITAMPVKYRVNKIFGVINYPAGKSTSTIATEIATTLLSEGVEAGTIETGINIGEAWANDCISLGEVMNEISEQNSFQWFIDKDFKLQFYRDANTVSSREIVEGGEFKDFRDIVISNTLDGYSNAVYFIGGNDVYENPVYAIRVNVDEFDYMQALIAGSGIYGEVIRNSNVTSCTAYNAGVGTSNTNLSVAGHPFTLNDHFYNKTRDLYGYVKAVVDANNITCTDVAGQVSGDVIVFYSVANNMNKESLRQKAISPKSIKFHSFDMTFFPQQRLRIELPTLNIASSYWCVESVEVSDAGRGYFNQIVTAVLRDVNDFSTQRRKNQAIDYFRQF